MRQAVKTIAESPELDERTLKRAQQGDSAACASLVRRYQSQVAALVSRMLMPSGRRAAIEDVAQETFLHVFRALPRWDARGEARLSRLAPEYRAVFVLREFHELSYQEIGRALDVGVGTVKSRLSRARAELRVALAEVHDD